MLISEMIADSNDYADEASGLPCAEKLTFSNRTDAQAAATVASYQHGTKLKPYVCRYCQLWHLASQYED